MRVVLLHSYNEDNKNRACLHHCEGRKDVFLFQPLCMQTRSIVQVKRAFFFFPLVASANNAVRLAFFHNVRKKKKETKRKEQKKQLTLNYRRTKITIN